MPTDGYLDRLLIKTLDSTLDNEKLLLKVYGAVRINHISETMIYVAARCSTPKRQAKIAIAVGTGSFLMKHTSLKVNVHSIVLLSLACGWLSD